MNRRNLIITFVVVLALAVGGFLVIRQVTSGSTSASANLQTTQVERSTLEASVSGAGTMASPQTATLTWQASGTVGSVHVSVGQVVEAGDVLMEFDLDRADPAMLQAQVDLLTAQAELETLLAGPTEQQLADAKLAVIEAQQTVTTAQRSLNNVINPSVAYDQDQYDRALDTLTAAQQNAEITNYQTSLNAAAVALENAANNLNNIQALEAQYPGYGAQRDHLKNAQAAYDTAAQNYQTALYRLQQAQNNDSETIHDAQQAFDTAKANLAVVQSGANQAKIALYQAQFEVAQANLTQAEADLATLQASPDPQDVAAARARVAAARANVDSAKLTAPFRGTIVAVQNRVGDEVNAGQSAVEIADLSALEIEVSIAEVDINSIAVGQSAELTVDAAPDQTFQGQVTEVAYLGTAQQGVVNFPVTVVVANPDPALKPGMTAAVSIITDQRANVLVVPNRAIRTSGGQSSVTVLFEGQQISVPVTIGLSGETMSEILDGALQEGDTIVVSTSTSTSATTGNQGRGGFLLGGGGGPPGP